MKRTTRAITALAASAGLTPDVVTLRAKPGEAGLPTKPRASYCVDGRIHVNELGNPEGNPLTTGHMDFKPSWSRTGDMLICFRRTRDDPVTVNWRSAIFVIQVDGTGFHLLSDGTRTDFNPTWTREGRNLPIWNRKNDRTGGFYVVQSQVGAQPGDEVAISDESFHTWAHSCLVDGRILVNSYHPTLGRGVFLMTRREKGKPLYQRVECELSSRGELHRASVSPGERRICFEFLRGFHFTEPGHTLYVADFDARQPAITNLKPIANQQEKPFWFAYPRWIEEEAAVVYHANQTGKGQLFVYRLADGSTTRVSTNPGADYRYPHGEAAPC